ncbi:asparagine synthetase domain-containing protein 1 [Trichonephila inaurata madagascariensis]|uniref:Asparagine synthetase domain-containing protein 1 n=1 Tax=Trichonephila inaurata madagascariensis TaxID=2747483 RepID=A0A8X6XBI3_9ARAC|nr:asparagine synthetase domain-containing protein 1 [Trichonephila inaurata madagascariensis]
MCGICVSLSFRVSSAANLRQSFAIVKNLVTRVKRRGPDHFQNVSFSFYDILDICLTSSVLQLRGSSLSQQPFTDGSGNYLLWNGEIFDGDMYKESESDTKILRPFAFVFYQNNGLLWFGRDIFGRRSLLWKADTKSFHLCSLSNLEEEESSVVSLLSVPTLYVAPVGELLESFLVSFVRIRSCASGV